MIEFRLLRCRQCARTAFNVLDRQSFVLRNMEIGFLSFAIVKRTVNSNDKTVKAVEANLRVESTGHKWENRRKEQD